MKKKLKYIKTYEGKVSDNNIGLDIYKLFNEYGIVLGNNLGKGNFVRELPDSELFQETSKTQYRIELLVEDDPNQETLQFSIFMDDSDYKKMWKPENEKHRIGIIFSKVGLYFSFLMKTFPEIYGSPGFFSAETAFQVYPKSFSLFLKVNSIQINNDTIAEAWDYSYRTYQDNKFFRNLQKQLGVGSYGIFIDKFEKLVSKKLK